MAEVMSHRSSYILRTSFDRYEGVLDVQFVDGSEYRYAGVPLGTYHSLITAPSIGRAFRQLIYDRFEGEEI